MSKLYVIISVDVEDALPLKFIHKGSVDQTKSMIYGKIGNEYFGYPKIMDICNEFNIKATFFLDVFEYKRYGEKTFENICQEMIKNGHDVQLHVHPNRGYDEKRWRMEEYSLEEQIKIIREGKELIKKWTGEYPVAYRGGGYYSINKDTITALKKNNIPMDTTMFYGNPDCKLTFSKNRVVKKDGIIEVPVTIFKRNLKTFAINLYSSYVKTDISWATLDELKFFVKKAKTNNIKVKNVFMHSYSLMKFNKDFSEFKPDYNNINKLKVFLKFISDDKSIKVLTMKEFYRMYKENPSLFIGSDYVPEYVVNEKVTSLIMKVIKKFIYISLFHL
jgi:hypothetical protein